MVVSWLAVLLTARGLKIPNGFISLSVDVDCVKGKRSAKSTVRGSWPYADCDGGNNVKLSLILMLLNFKTIAYLLKISHCSKSVCVAFSLGLRAGEQIAIKQDVLSIGEIKSLL